MSWALCCPDFLKSKGIQFFSAPLWFHVSKNQLISDGWAKQSYNLAFGQDCTEKEEVLKVPGGCQECCSFSVISSRSQCQMRLGFGPGRSMASEKWPEIAPNTRSLFCSASICLRLHYCKFTPVDLLLPFLVDFVSRNNLWIRLHLSANEFEPDFFSNGRDQARMRNGVPWGCLEMWRKGLRWGVGERARVANFCNLPGWPRLMDMVPGRSSAFCPSYPPHLHLPVSNVAKNAQKTMIGPPKPGIP